MTDPNAPSDSEPLQFDRAVDAETAAPDSETQDAPGLECSSCNTPIKTYYYHVNNATVCAKCKQTTERAGKAQRGGGAFLKAFLLGALAAVVGAGIYYGVIALTNFEIGIVAILIGFIVGAAVRIGAAGAGGRRYQVMALLLTYFAVGLAYTPLAIKGAMEAGQLNADSLALADSLSDAAGTDDVANNELAAADSMTVALAGEASDSSVTGLAGAGIAGIGGALLGLAIIAVGGFLMVFALPVIAVLGSLPSGLISAFIIGLGMHQAWKMTAGHIVAITGPYKVGAPSVAPAAPESAG